MEPLNIKYKKRKLVDAQAMLGRSLSELPPIEELESNYKHLIPRLNKILRLTKIDEVDYSSAIFKRDYITDFVPTHWCTTVLYYKLGCHHAFHAPSKIIEICDNIMKVTVYPRENSGMVRISLEISLSQDKGVPNELSLQILTLDNGFSKDRETIDGSIIFDDELRLFDMPQPNSEVISFVKISDKGKIVCLDFTEGSAACKSPGCLEQILFKICDWEDVNLHKQTGEIRAEYYDFFFSITIDEDARLLKFSNNVNFGKDFTHDVFEEAFDIVADAYYDVEAVTDEYTVKISVELDIKGNAEINVSRLIQKMLTLRDAFSYFVANAKILMDYTEIPELFVGLPENTN